MNHEIASWLMGIQKKMKNSDVFCFNQRIRWVFTNWTRTVGKSSTLFKAQDADVFYT